MPVSGVAQFLCRDGPIRPNCRVPRLAWAGKFQYWARLVDQAQFLGPEVIFRHVGKSPKGPHAANSANLPAGFFQHFTVQCLRWRFTGVNSAAGKLKLGCWVRLMRQQKLPVARQDRVHTGAARIPRVMPWTVAESPDHCLLPLGHSVVLII